MGSRPQSSRASQPIKVLLLAANPGGTAWLQLDEELRQIRTRLRMSEHRDAIELVPWFAARPDDLVQGLLEHRPQIVHFSGHGSSTHELLFVDDDGKPRPVGARSLAQVFGILRDDVRLVLLNACYSDVQARAIGEHIDFTVGMTRAVGDAAAIVFAAAFYRALGFGRSIQESFELGRAALMLEDIPEELTPTLLSRPGVPDPAYFESARAEVVRHPTVIVAGAADEPTGPGHPETLRYVERIASGRLHLEPRDPYLDLVRGGGELGPLDFWHSPWEDSFLWPAVDVKVVNNTDRTVMFHRAVFEVAESRPDLRAIPIIRGTAYGTYLPLGNAGWGTMTDCVLRFRIHPDPAAEAVTPEFEWRFGGIDQAEDSAELRGFLGRAGVDFEALDRLTLTGWSGSTAYLRADSGLGLPVPSGSMFSTSRQLSADEYHALRRQALGPFADGLAVLRGTLSYTHVELDGMPAPASHPIVSYISFDEPAVGAPMPASFTYQVRLRSEGRNYQVDLPVSQVVAPGAADRFVFTIAADRSSLHDFRLSLRYNDSLSVTSDPVSLELFLSRYDARWSIGD